MCVDSYKTRKPCSLLDLMMISLLRSRDEWVKEVLCTKSLCVQVLRLGSWYVLVIAKAFVGGYR